MESFVVHCDDWSYIVLCIGAFVVVLLFLWDFGANGVPGL